MIKKYVNRHEVVLHDGGIQHLPVLRFQEANRAIAVDTGIGSDFNSIDQHILHAMKLVKVDPDSAIQELQNCRENYQFVMANISPKMNAFVPFVYSIDGRVLTDLDMTDEGKTAVIRELDKMGTTYQQVKNWYESVKKKMDSEFSIFFPEIGGGKSSDFYTRLKQKTLLQIDVIVKGASETSTDQLAAIDKYMLLLNKPQNFAGSKGVEVIMAKGFEASCSLLQQTKIELSPRELSTFSFFQALETAKEQIKQKDKALRRK